MPKVVFIAHPVAGNIQENVKNALSICKSIHTHDILPVAPYLESLQYLDDDKPEERKLGQARNKEFFTRKMIDELWLCGPRISDGMKEEVELSLKHGIPIKCYNPDLQAELDKIVEEFKTSRNPD